MLCEFWIQYSELHVLGGLQNMELTFERGLDTSCQAVKLQEAR
jgi:hypothetical protein